MESDGLVTVFWMNSVLRGQVFFFCDVFFLFVLQEHF